MVGPPSPIARRDRVCQSPSGMSEAHAPEAHAHAPAPAPASQAPAVAHGHTHPAPQRTQSASELLHGLLRFGATFALPREWRGDRAIRTSTATVNNNDDYAGDDRDDCRDADEHDRGVDDYRQVQQRLSVPHQDMDSVRAPRPPPFRHSVNGSQPFPSSSSSSSSTAASTLSPYRHDNQHLLRQRSSERRNLRSRAVSMEERVRRASARSLGRNRVREEDVDVDDVGVSDRVDAHARSTVPGVLGATIRTVISLLPTTILRICARILLGFLLVAASLRFVHVYALPHLRNASMTVFCETVPFADMLVGGTCATVLAGSKDGDGTTTASAISSDAQQVRELWHKLGEVSAKSADYAELLVKTNLPPTVTLSLSKLALEDLTVAVEYSALSYRDTLVGNLQEMIDLTDRLFDKISGLGASARGTVDTLYNYVDVVVRTVTVESNDRAVAAAAVHDSPARMLEQYDALITSIDKQIESLQVEAGEADSSLRDVKEKLKSIDKLIHAERNAQDRAENEALPYLWSSVFQYKERAKFAKNLHLLNQLDSQIRAAKASVATIIGLLIDFRHDLTQLRRSTGRAQLAMQVSVELHVEILRTSLRRLRQSKEEIGTKRGRMASGNGGDVVHPGGATIGATTMAMADSEGDD